MKSIDLSKNQIEGLQIEFTQINSLETFRIDSNKLQTLPEYLGQLTKLRELLASKNLIEHLPESIGCLASLEKFDVSDNHIQSLPESLGQLTALRELLASKNLIEHLPEGIGNIHYLRTIELSHNKVKNIPSALFQLKSLNYLDLSLNYLDFIPDSIAGLKNLISLRLEQNNICFLPVTFNQLQNLNFLNLRNNPFKELPKDFTNLKNIWYFDIRFTRIEKFDENLKNWCFSILKKGGLIRGIPPLFYQEIAVKNLIITWKKQGIEYRSLIDIHSTSRLKDFLFELQNEEQQIIEIASKGNNFLINLGIGGPFVFIQYANATFEFVIMAKNDKNPPSKPMNYIHNDIEVGISPIHLLSFKEGIDAVMDFFTNGAFPNSLEFSDRSYSLV